MFEPQERNEPFAAERKIEARDEGAVTVNAEPDAIRHVEVTQREIAAAGGYLAGIDEDGAVERPPRLPPVLGGQQDAVSILKPELSEPAKRLGASERRLEIERHLLAGAGIGEVRRGVKGDR